jgi:para-nitrobenzyl esterase
VVDNVTLFEPPVDAIRGGNATGVDVIAGTNGQEMTLFLAGDPSFGTMTDALIVERARNVIGDAADQIVAGYRARRPDVSPQEVWLDLATDIVFRFPALQLLEAQMPYASAWSYLFTWKTPVFGGFLQSTHALEIPFVFDNLAKPDAELFTGTGAERQPIADAMHNAWISFARSGNPDHAGIPHWPAYDTTERPTLRFDTTVELLDDPGAADRTAFTALVD